MRHRTPALLLLAIAGLSCDGGASPGDADSSGAAAEPHAAADLDSGAPEPDAATAPDVGADPFPDPPPDPIVGGRLYVDGDADATSLYDQSFDPRHDTGLGGAAVALVSASGELSATTAADGTFGFAEVPPGSWFVVPDLPPDDVCTTHACAPRVAAAVRSGHVRAVTFGDSLPGTGPKPTFPERLGDHLAALAPAESVDVAVGGTTTGDWMPGTPLFESVLAPELAAADLVVVSLGGNDLKDFVFDHGGVGAIDPLALLDAFPPFFDALVANLLAILDEVRARAPEADLVYCVYANYGLAGAWQDLGGDLAPLMPAIVGGVMADLRLAVSEVPGLVVADVASALTLVVGEEGSIDPYLSDPLHLSALGHAFYADEIFLALGGAVVSENGLATLGGHRLIGLAP